MSLHLDEFVEITAKQLEDFAKTWRENNAKYPAAYPMELPDSDEGLWFEFFADHKIRE